MRFNKQPYGPQTVRVPPPRSSPPTLERLDVAQLQVVRHSCRQQVDGCRRVRGRLSLVELLQLRVLEERLGGVGQAGMPPVPPERREGGLYAVARAFMQSQEPARLCRKSLRVYAGAVVAVGRQRAVMCTMPSPVNPPSLPLPLALPLSCTRAVGKCGRERRKAKCDGARKSKGRRSSPGPAPLLAAFVRSTLL